jgi:hypothetical protein
MAIYLFSVKTFVFFFFHCSSFDKKEGVGLFYNWCSLTTPYCTRDHINVGDIYILYIIHKTRTDTKFCRSRSRSHIATDGQSVSKSWCRAPSGVHDQIYITVWQLRSCFCGAPSLTRGRVCLLNILLALASAVFLGPEFLGTRDRILLSLIWDFPFRRLLRLAGARWRYSTPPPHGS